MRALREGQWDQRCTGVRAPLYATVGSDRGAEADRRRVEEGGVVIQRGKKVLGFRLRRSRVGNRQRRYIFGEERHDHRQCVQLAELDETGKKKDTVGDRSRGRRAENNNKTR